MCEQRSAEKRHTHCDPTAMHARPQLRTVTRGARIEMPMSAVILFRINWFPQIIRTMSIFRAVMLLRIVTGARQIVIEQPRKKFVYDNCANRRHADINFAAWIMGGINNCFGRDLRLENRRNWLRLSRKPAFDPAEL